MANDNDPVTTGSLRAILNEFFEQKFAFLENLQVENVLLKAKVEELESKVENLENYSRNNNIVVYGVPIQENEDPLDLAVNLGKVVGYEINSKDIDTAHRLPSKKITQTPPFIMRLVSRTTKSEIMLNAKKCAKKKKLTADLFGGEAGKNIYFNEHLTKKNQDVFAKARCLWDNYIIYTKNGRVMGRPKEGGEKFEIKDIDEIEYYKNYRPNQQENQQGNNNSWKYSNTHSTKYRKAGESSTWQQKRK